MLFTSRAGFWLVTGISAPVGHLTTHSPQFLDAFADEIPATTVALWEDGQTVLKMLEGDLLNKWLGEYSLGHLFTSGELEDLG